MTGSHSNILEVDRLITSFETDRGLLRAVDQVSFVVPAGKTVGLVGESGCGKSVTAMSIVRLLPQPAGKILGGRVMFKGQDLIHAGDADIRRVRGGEIGVIFQEPMAALNPVHRIGRQVAEVFRLHQKLSNKDAWDAATEMLELVRIPAPAARMMDYPHQLSGGMRQRIVIALALACRPDLVMARLRAEMNMSMILITHDLGVIAETCDEVVVMYGGRVVERAQVHELFAHPLHAYTRGLLDSIPTLATPSKAVLKTIPGMVASLADHTHGCRFCQRLGRSAASPSERPVCTEVSPGHWVETCPLCYQP